MIEQLRAFFPSFGYLEESPLKTAGDIQAWQVTAFDKNNSPNGSGFAKDLEAARKIAVAEFIERKFVQVLRQSPDRDQWRLQTNPTSCGFAAGYDPLNTKIRSVGEALERWALSQWMDFNCPLDAISNLPSSSVNSQLLKSFDELKSFKKDFVVRIDNSLISFELCVLVAFKDSGAYMGCAVRNTIEEAFAHSLVEAQRHLIISQQDRNFELFPYNRIKYFSSNKAVAIKLLESSKIGIWPLPQIDFQKEYHNDLFCICRTILKDWVRWELGPENKLLY